MWARDLHQDATFPPPVPRKSHRDALQNVQLPTHHALKGEDEQGDPHEHGKAKPEEADLRDRRYMVWIGARGVSGRGGKGAVDRAHPQGLLARRSSTGEFQ